jgi:hypothetical protein
MKRLIVLTSILMVIAACARVPEPAGSISGRLVAGPTCPVETNPPDPACAAALVAGATVTAITSNGDEYTAESDEDGRFVIDVPSGETTLHFGEVEGLMGTPDEVTVEVTEGENVDLGDLAYDTGIR